jgi:hypothetical protein
MTSKTFILRSASLALLETVVTFGAIATAAPEPGGQIHGFFSQGYARSTVGTGFPVGTSGRPNGTFEFSDYGVNFTVEPAPNLRVGIQLFAQDRGTYGDGKLLVDWAFGDYRIDDELGIRIGKIQMPNGLYNTSRDNDALRTSILLPQGIYSDYYRDLVSTILGGGVYGSLRGSWGTLRYEAYGGTLPFTKESAVAAAFDSVDASSGSTGSVGLTWETPVDGLRASFTHLRTSARGRSPLGPGLPALEWSFDDSLTSILSIEYAAERLTLAAELQNQDYLLAFGPFIPVTRWKASSIYGAGAYRLTSWLEIGAYHNRSCLDRSDCSGATFARFDAARAESMFQHDTALTLRFDVLPNLVLKAEGHALRGHGLNYLTRTEDLPARWSLLLVKATFTF